MNLGISTTPMDTSPVYRSKPNHGWSRFDDNCVDIWFQLFVLRLSLKKISENLSPPEKTISPETLEEGLARPSSLHVQLEVCHQVDVADDRSIRDSYVPASRNQIPNLSKEKMSRQPPPPH